jgi:hypothetical protein
MTAWRILTEVSLMLIFFPIVQRRPLAPDPACLTVIVGPNPAVCMLTCGRVAFVLAPAFDRLFFSAALALSVAEIPEHHR